jgi:hypothetical protein
MMQPSILQSLEAAGEPLEQWMTGQIWYNPHRMADYRAASDYGVVWLKAYRDRIASARGPKARAARPQTHAPAPPPA